jgi:hypothetical protein
MYSDVKDRTPELVDKLPVDRSHPMFFDHPLDHIPGMLMLSEAMRQVGKKGPAERRRMAATFTFHKFAEFEPAVETWMTPGETDGSWDSEMVQNGTVLCGGRFSTPNSGPWAEVADEVPDTNPDGWRPPPRVPASGHLVRRSRSENVLLGQPASNEDLVRVALIDPPEGHYFRARAADARSAEEMVEAARQFATLLWIRDPGTKPEAQLVLNEVEFDLPCSLPRSALVELRWHRQAMRGSRWRLVFEASAAGHAFGTATVDFRGVSATAYRRLRGRDD